LDISQCERGEQIVDYAVMLDLLIEAYVQFLIMLTELKKVLSKELKWCVGVARLPQVNMTAVPKNNGCESLTFLLHLK
jgi:hypothetical protein